MTGSRNRHRSDSGELESDDSFLVILNAYSAVVDSIDLGAHQSHRRLSWQTEPANPGVFRPIREGEPQPWAAA
jgi:hypothetical protein